MPHLAGETADEAEKGGWKVQTHFDPHCNTLKYSDPRMNSDSMWSLMECAPRWVGLGAGLVQGG